MRFFPSIVPNTEISTLRQEEPSGNSLLFLRIRNNSESDREFSLVPLIGSPTGARIIEPGEIAIHVGPQGETEVPFLVSSADYVVFDLSSSGVNVRIGEDGETLDRGREVPYSKSETRTPPLEKAEQKVRAKLYGLSKGIGVLILLAATVEITGVSLASVSLVLVAVAGVLILGVTLYVVVRFLVRMISELLKPRVAYNL